MLTVLTHGFQANATRWSNNVVVDKRWQVGDPKQNYDNNGFAYDSYSLIEQLRAKSLNGAVVYWARMARNKNGIGDGFYLIELGVKNNFERYNYFDDGTNNDGVKVHIGGIKNTAETRVLAKTRITDVSKHTIIVFDAEYASEQGDLFFKNEFHYMMDRIVYDMKLAMGGIYPKINLIGHSRGGLVNLDYAMDHPKLIDTIISIGTPYHGVNHWRTQSDARGLSFAKTQGYRDINDFGKQQARIKKWNAGAYGDFGNITVHALSASCDSQFVHDLFYYNLPPEHLVPIFFQTTFASVIRSDINVDMAASVNSQKGILVGDFWDQSVPNAAGLIVEPNRKRLSSSDQRDYLNFNTRHKLYNGNMNNRLNSIKWWDGGGVNGRIRVGNPYDISRNSLHVLEPRSQDFVEFTRDTLTLGGGMVASRVLENGTFEVTGPNYIPLNGEIIIPGIINGRLVTSIATNAFVNQDQLTQISIPLTVTSIATNAFMRCNNLESIIVNPNNPSFASRDGILYNKAMTEFLLIPDALKGEIVIPNSILFIEAFTFSNRVNLTKITIPNSVISIGLGAFDNTGIWNGAQQNSVVYADNWAVGYKGNLGKVELKSGTVGIGNFAFEYSNLTSVTMPDSLRHLGIGAFANCINLQKVELPNMLRIIGGMAFYGCSNLHEIHIPESVSDIGAATFANSGLENIYLNSVEPPNIGLDTFENTTDLIVWIRHHVAQIRYKETWGEDFDFRTESETLHFYYRDTENNELIHIESKSVFQFSFFQDLPTPSHDGYWFDGWYDVFGKLYTDGMLWDKELSEDWILIAAFSPRRNVVSFDVDGGIYKESFYLTVEETHLLSDGIKRGHTFAGWFDNNEFIGQPIQIIESLTSNLKLYAKFEAITVKISFDMPVGEQIADMYVTFGSHFEIAATPTKTNHALAGWYYIDEHGNEIRVAGSNGFSMRGSGFISDVVLFPKWNLQKVTIIFDVGTEFYMLGESGLSEEIMSVFAGQNINPNDAALRDLFIQQGWTFHYFKDDSGNIIVDWDSVPDFGSAFTTLIIYPHLTANTYFITYDSDNGIMHESDEAFLFDCESGVLETIASLGFSERGHDFEGWAFESNGKQIRVDADLADNLTLLQGLADEDGARITLVALWRPLEITITYSVEGVPKSDELPPTGRVVFGAKAFNLYHEVTTTAYDFHGWYTGRNGTGTRLTNARGEAQVSAFDFDQNITVYAHFTPTVYRLTLIAVADEIRGTTSNFQSSGFTRSVSGSEIHFYRDFTVRDSFTIPSASDTGKVFVNWLVIGSASIATFGNDGFVQEKIPRVNLASGTITGLIGTVTLRANFQFTSIRPTSWGTLPTDINDSHVIINYADYYDKWLSPLFVGGNVRELTIQGGGKTYESFSIFIEDASSIILRFHNFNFSAPSDYHGVSHTKSTLVVEAYGSNTIRGGSPIRHISSSTPTLDSKSFNGNSAFSGPSFRFAGSGRFILHGGNGAEGAQMYHYTTVNGVPRYRGQHGGDGGHAVNASSSVEINTPNFEAFGGKGGNGFSPTQFGWTWVPHAPSVGQRGIDGFGGGDGGVGGRAIFCQTTLHIYSQVIRLTAGDSGNGAEGGKGGKGGTGAAGRDWVLFSTSTNGSNGARGGDGGYGGNAYRGVAAVFVASGSMLNMAGSLIRFNGQNGIVGKGGAAGEGGDGGLGGIRLDGDRQPSGARGANGNIGRDGVLI